MKRLFLILIQLSAALPMLSQVSELDTFLSSPGEESVMTIGVGDKATGQPLGGAVVFLSCGKDTLESVTDNYGDTFFSGIPFAEDKDTLTLTISFLGYKSLTHKYLHRHFVRFKALMEEDPEQLAEIIVRADAVAMVVRGDTTIFNASAYSSMDGDNLASLLRKLPGISLADGKLYANGQPVSKILLNGTAMFHSDMGAAMELVKSDEVRKVKVYDQYDQTRLLEADTLGMKERVVDIETKKPVDIVRRRLFSAAAGVFKDRNMEGDMEITAGAGLDYDRFGVDMPSYSLNASIGHNQKELSPRQTPSRNVNLLFSTRNFKRFKNNYSHLLRVSYDDVRTERYTRTTYTDTGLFDEKETEITSLTGDRTLTVGYNGTMGWALGENNSLDIALSLNYIHMGNDSQDRTLVMTDGTGSSSDISGPGGSDSFSGTAKVSFRHNFRKKGRSLEFAAAGGYGADDGYSHRVDTSAVTTVPQWMRRKMREDAGHFKFSTIYEEPFSDMFTMMLKYQFNAGISNRKRLSFDRLKGWTDTLDTYDYCHIAMDNMVSAGLTFRSRKKNFSMDVNVEYNTASQVREDRFPETLLYDRVYRHVSPYVRMNYSGTRLNFNMIYSEEQVIPSVEETRKMLDDSSPLFIIAGNPGLKQAINRNLTMNMNITFPKVSGSLQMLLMYSHTQDAAVRKTVYFSEDTWLPEYGCNAPAGSQLSTPVNVNGMSSLTSRLRWSSYLSSLNTTLGVGPTFLWRKSPFMTGDTFHTTETRSAAVSLDISSTILKYADVTLNSVTAFGPNLLDGERVYRSLSEDLDCRLRVNLFKILWLKTDFTWSLMETDSDIAPGYSRELLNAGVSWKFGRERIFEVGFDCHDILDSNNTWFTLIEENQVVSGFSSIYGTSFLVSFKCEF